MSIPVLNLINVNKKDSLSYSRYKLSLDWIRNLYRKHLKKFTIFRFLAVNVQRIFNLIYIKTTFAVHDALGSSQSWLPLFKLGEYVKTLHLSTTEVFDPVRVDIPSPNVFPAEDRAFLGMPYSHYVFPSVYVAEMRDTKIYGDSNLVYTKGAAICHDLYNFERDYAPEEINRKNIIDAKKMRIRLLRHDANPEKIPVAATFVDACSSNYAHWITEVLPRIAVFCSVKQYKDVPIIIDSGLHRNIMESLACVVGGDRQVIALPEDRALNVDTLYVTSVTGYVPFETKTRSWRNKCDGFFCPFAFDLMRECILTYVKKNHDKGYSKNLYLKRTSKTRILLNEDELNEFLTERGFDVVVPETLDFLQQITLVNMADRVISVTGAALANLIFSKSKPRVSILISKHNNMVYGYWVNILFLMGLKVDYILCERADFLEGSVHSNFCLDLNILVENKELFQDNKLSNSST
jgi:capsular polysaccharide biosynthesis protein